MDEIGFPDREPHVLGPRAGALQIRFRKHHRELFAAVATGDVGGADALSYGARYRIEHEIACVVSELVIESLEVIDVDHHYGHRLAAALSAMQLSVECVFQVTSVVQPGETIPQRHLTQRVAQFEVCQRGPDSVRHRAQALFGVARRALAAGIDIHRNMQQTQDLPLALDRHAGVALDILVHMPTADGALAWYEMRASQPQRPAFVRRQRQYGWFGDAPGGGIFEHVARLTRDEKRTR